MHIQFCYSSGYLLCSQICNHSRELADSKCVKVKHFTVHRIQNENWSNYCYFYIIMLPPDIHPYLDSISASHRFRIHWIYKILENNSQFFFSGNTSIIIIRAFLIFVRPSLIISALV